MGFRASRVIDELKRLDDSTLVGYRNTLLDNGLQSATRAKADEADIDWIIVALAHNVGDDLATQNHDKFFC